MSRIDRAMQRAGSKGPATAPAELPTSPWNVVPVREDRTTDASRLTISREVRGVSFSSAWAERCVVSPDVDQTFVEQFRRLGAVMHNAQGTNGVKLVLVASATQADGKTSMTLNLGMVLARSYNQRVLLIDGDLRRPSLGNVLDLPDVTGLGEALKATSDQKLSIVQVAPDLHLLPGGRPDPDPMRWLTSPRMREILEEARELFDWVLVDSPPMEPAADAQVLAEMVDAVVFVVRAGRTQHAQVEKAVNTIGRDRILGVILNGVEEMPYEHYYYPPRAV